MKWYQNLKLDIECKFIELADRLEERKYKKKYPNWNWKTWIGDLELVFNDRIDLPEQSIHDWSDFEVCYDHGKKLYILWIETALLFDNKNSECDYLMEQLQIFTDYMDKNDLDINQQYCFFMNDLRITNRAQTIEELYTNFKIFVEGFCVIHNK